jgi:hypothetical protein
MQVPPGWNTTGLNSHCVASRVSINVPCIRVTHTDEVKRSEDQAEPFSKACSNSFKPELKSQFDQAWLYHGTGPYSIFLSFERKQKIRHSLQLAYVAHFVSCRKHFVSVFHY